MIHHRDCDRIRYAKRARTRIGRRGWSIPHWVKVDIKREGDNWIIDGQKFRIPVEKGRKCVLCQKCGAEVYELFRRDGSKIWLCARCQGLPSIRVNQIGCNRGCVMNPKVLMKRGYADLQKMGYDLQSLINMGLLEIQ